MTTIDDEKQAFDAELEALQARLDKAEVAAAYHEAGHSVVCMSLGFEVTQVSIRDKHAGGAGCTDYTTPNEDWFREQMGGAALFAKMRFVVARAGELATLHKFPGEDFGGHGSDYEKMGECATAIWAETYKGRDVPDAELQIIPNALSSIAEDRVEQHWCAIERIAEALLARKLLTGDEIKALFYGATQKEAAA